MMVSYAALALRFLAAFGRCFLFRSARAAPKILRDFGGVDPDGSPPCALIAGVVNGAVVDATERDGELIASLAAHCTWLHEAQMMGIRGFSGAYKARLLCNKFKMFFAAIAARFGDLEHALIDAGALTGIGMIRRGGRLST